ncbi:HGGxSTG domain-containing protein [Legionella bozemanae]|uniref:HGGxSTG domain-containing protein n=1 Tax=Legionella bozemanae TaxID=447 RepID=UPI003EED141A
MKTTSRTEKHYSFEFSPRCGARAKGNNGQPCRCPAVKGKTRCRVHGGALGSGAPKGNTNALKHGQSTSEIKLHRENVIRALRESKKLLSKTI